MPVSFWGFLPIDLRSSYPKQIVQIRGGFVESKIRLMFKIGLCNFATIDK